MSVAAIIKQIAAGDIKALARTISLVENEAENYEELLMQLPTSYTKIIGITGPPGAGKSTLTDGLISHFVQQGKKMGILCIDPSSPFNLGALLGDRIRMSEWYNHPQVFIRSLATRGSLGGLNAKIIEITDVMKAAPFDYIIVETVGVGQSEVEIAGLADVTVVVLVPEAGDEIQTMKAGLMEIADVFVVNKADRPGAELFTKNLRMMLMPSFDKKDNEIAILQTIASQKDGVESLVTAIINYLQKQLSNEKKSWLMAEKAYRLILKKRMADINKLQLNNEISAASKLQNFNLYAFVQNTYIDKS